MAWLSHEQLMDMGFARIGKNVLLSDKASYYNCKNIWLGDNIRIDDFCVLSAGEGGIEIGSNIHIAVFCSLIGRGKIKLHDFSGLSSRVSVYSSSDDFGGKTLTNPTVPAEFTNVTHADVDIGRHVLVGSGSIVLPGLTLEEGVAVGAMSLVKNDCKSFGIYIGVPAKRVAERKRDLLDLEKKYISASGG